LKDFQRKVAFITGGASGIGLSMAKAFLKEGLKIAIADIRRDRLTKAEAILNNPLNVLPIELDVRDRTAMERAADKVEATFDKVHIVCNNAGIGGGRGKIHEIQSETWKNVLDVNLGGVFNGIQVFVPRIKRHGEGGHIVNTSSMTGITPITGSGPYGASKAAVAVITEILHDELADEAIGVSLLAPWIVKTSIFHADLADDDAEGIKKRNKAMLEYFGESLTDPDTVAEMVLNGIRNNELYIFNDKVCRNMLEKRISKMYAAIDRQFPGSQLGI
jgi:NAD(P)-dependent dehydrogenase (short-subunit alcohol dehydrogenase family)